MANAKARCVVTFVMEYEAGAWGDDCQLGQLRKQALDGAQTAAACVVQAAAKEAHAKLRVLKITTPSVIFDEADHG